MGGWKLEVSRMTAYVALPIVCFYLFNKPEYFKEILTETKQYYFPQEDPESIQQLNAYKKEKEKETEKKILAQIEALKQSKK